MHVRRHRTGDWVSVVDGEGTLYHVELKELRKKCVIGLIREKHPQVGEPGLHLALAQALPKSRKMDLVIEKGTELGVSEFIPFLSDHGVVRPTKTDHKTERWRNIAISAMKQCGRSVLPIIQPVSSWEDVLTSCSRFEAVFVADPMSSKPLTLLRSDIRRALIIIGPEGGLSETEMNQLRQQDVLFFAMGNRVLRTETAGFVATVLVLHEAGKLSRSQSKGGQQ